MTSATDAAPLSAATERGVLPRGTEAADDYLEAILELEEEGTRVIQARLAAHLGVSAPSVSAMVRRLCIEGYLSVGTDRTLALTDQGRRRAITIVRRHRLAERVLVDVLGLPWHRAHVEARRWEHIISADVEELMAAKLVDASTCPHGNPIPGSGVAPIDLVCLSETQAGDRIRLERVSEGLELDYDALVYLEGHSFIPGAEGTISTVAPDQTRVVTVGDHTIAVGPGLAAGLYVRLLAA